MNILFFLSPKQDLMYVYDDFTLRQTLEKWENNRYASIPVLNRKGEYVGTLTEGDILWGLKKFHGLDLEAAEDIPIRDFAHKRDYKAVTVTTSMDQLIEAAMNQNFVPVVDDRGMFIGIVRRQAIIRYCYDRSRAAAAEQQHVDGALHPVQGVQRIHGYAGRLECEAGGRASGKHAHQRHVRVLPQRVFHAAPQVAVAHDTDSDLIHMLSSPGGGQRRPNRQADAVL